MTNDFERNESALDEIETEIEELEAICAPAIGTSPSFRE
jgi:hypothetical protein